MGIHYSVRRDWRRKIDQSEFFFVLQDNYDEHAELAIPGYIEMHDALSLCLSDKEGGIRALDLGCGTGKTAKVVLTTFPTSTVVGIDLFEEMLGHARSNLADFGSRFSTLQGDVRDVSFGSGFDVCVAGLALHHLSGAEKGEVFRKIFQCLNPGGRFLMIDWTRFKNPLIQEAAAQVAEAHVREHVQDQEVVAAWVQHWREKNRPDTVEDLTEWMRTAGFSGVECVMRNFGMALIAGEK